ncbi:MAG: hypothetical protein AB1489_39270 [Acidobacteriota bacterium]
MLKKIKSRNCSCYGSNENCMWCSGTGLIETIITHKKDCNRTVTKLRSANKILDQKLEEARKLETTNCPKCNVPIRATDLDWHLRDHNNRKPGFKRTKDIQPKQPKLSPCRFCNQFVKQKQIKQHILQHHSESNSGQKVDEIISKNKRSNRELVNCSFCINRVRLGRLERHIKKVHNDDNLNVEKAQSKPIQNSNINMEKKVDELVKSINSRRLDSFNDKDPTISERRLDYTKPYAHFYRENGKFGSHPSHDNFGDESEP